jgi:hypothetical protein
MFTTKLKTTADVLSVFTKTIQDLKNVVTTHETEAVKQRDVASAALTRAEVSEAEVVAAKAAINKLEAFLA